MLRIRPIRCRLPKACLAALLVSAPGLTQEATVREEVVDRDGRPAGFIDWTEQKVYARADAATAVEAAAAARGRLYQVLLVVTVDDATCVGDRVRRYQGLDADLRALTTAAEVTQSYPAGQGYRAFVAVPLFGKAGLYATLIQPRPERAAAPDLPAPPSPAAAAPKPPSSSPAVLPEPAPVGGAFRAQAPAAAAPAAPGAALPAAAVAAADAKRPTSATAAKARPASPVVSPPRVESPKPAPPPTLTRIAQAEGIPAPASVAPASAATAAVPTLPASTGRAQPESPPPARRVAPAAVPAPPTAQAHPTIPPLDLPDEGPFTGLLVDARGLNLKRCISPLIVTESGRTVYGHFDNMTPAQLQYAHNTGIVSYLMDPVFATKSRAGACPLVVRGLGVEGVYKGNVVVSDADADRVLAEDRRAKFLAKMNVAILK